MHSASILLDKCSSDLELYGRDFMGQNNITNIEKLLSSEIVVMSYKEAVELLSRKELDSYILPLVDSIKSDNCFKAFKNNKALVVHAKNAHKSGSGTRTYI